MASQTKAPPYKEPEGKKYNRKTKIRDKERSHLLQEHLPKRHRCRRTKGPPRKKKEHRQHKGKNHLAHQVNGLQVAQSHKNDG